MLSEKELQISGKSYTNKDFPALYTELVDQTNALTTRWDPRTSNESDPGVVILKELAFMGDKINYNIDKNVLEPFMPTCTQETSMRQNCESRGYEMSYYNSATTKVRFTYNGEELGETDVIKLPAYSTVVKSSDDSVYYIITQEVEFTSSQLVCDVPAIEGELFQLTVANATDETLIQLSNLDDNDRIYLPIKNVAQNGIFIANEQFSTQWNRVSNLNVEELGQPNFKFGYDSKKGLPYIEFPRDIANLIGNGLSINYIATKGKDGNVQANYLTQLASTTATKNGEEWTPNLEGDNPDLYIRNESASINGSGIETIDEAYSNYKRTIGVFDTLVTCRDYESAIYSILKDESPYVSNAHVADRRDDINYSTRYYTYSKYGKIYVNASYTNCATAYNLCLYPLNPFTTYSLENYYDSFKPLYDVGYVWSDIEDRRCVSHDYKNLSANDIYAIKNYSKLNARLVTTYKVNSYERAQIIQNVQNALMSKFNARQVEYGVEIPYDTILETIQNADSRIASVSLSEPELSTSYMLASGTEVARNSYNATPADSGLHYFTLELARNVLNGKVSLLDFNDDFDIDLGQNSTSILTNLAKVDTNANIEIPDDATMSYTLKENEVIQIVGPSLLDELTYSAYIYYDFNPSNTSTVVNAGTVYELKPGDVLYIYYTDSDKKPQKIKYTSGTLIQPMGLSLELTPQSAGGGRVQRPSEDGDKWYYALSASESINMKKLNSTRLGTLTSCYWLRNNANNELFLASDYSGGVAEIILGDDEYFFYTDKGFNTLISVGSGTTIKTNMPYAQDFWCVDKVSIKDIVEKGLLQLKDYWKQINFTANNTVSGTYLDMQENSIITLVEGNTIKLSNLTTERYITNSLVELQDSDFPVTFTIDGNTDNVTPYDVASMKWRIKSRLDIISGKDNYQKLVGSQVVKFYDKDNNTLTLNASNDDVFNLNMFTDIAGGVGVDLSTLNSKNELEYPLSVYKYVASASQPTRNTQDMAEITLEAGNDVTYDTPKLTGMNSLLMLYWTPGAANSYLYVTAKNSSDEDVTITFYPDTEYEDITDEGMYVLNLPDTVASINLASDEGGKVTLSKPRFFSGYNPQLGIETLAEELALTDAQKGSVYGDLESRISTLSGGKFYYSLKVDDTNAIESDDLSSPYALYDYNNVANKCVITEIDIENSDIDVARSSRT